MDAAGSFADKNLIAKVRCMVLWNVTGGNVQSGTDALYGLGGYVNDFICWLTDGHNLERLMFCPIEVYEMMEDCWSLTASERPTFAQLRQRLDVKVSKESSDTYLTLDVLYMKFNQDYQNMLQSMAKVGAALPASDEAGEDAGQESEADAVADEETVGRQEGSEVVTDDHADEGVELSDEEADDLAEDKDERSDAQPAARQPSTNGESSSEFHPQKSSSQSSRES